MTALTTTPSDPAFWQALARLHGHRCPMSILGARLGLAAREALGGARSWKQLSARYHHRTCALDGVQMATSCTLGNGNLQIEPTGEHLLVLWDPETRDQARVRLSEEALAAGRRYGELRRTSEGLAPGTTARTAADEEAETILAWLESAPAESLVTIERPGR